MVFHRMLHRTWGDSSYYSREIRNFRSLHSLDGCGLFPLEPFQYPKKKKEKDPMTLIHGNPQRYTQAARMRHHPTKSERLVWSLLRGRQFGHRFHRQKVIGNYIVDFWCPSLGLVLEVDGPTHMFPSARTRDTERDQALLHMGVKRIVRLPSEIQFAELLSQLELATGVQFGRVIERKPETSCEKHPESGRTNWGTCWECYVDKYLAAESLRNRA
jgi:very-short-patch-repair endonuclease